MVRVKCVIIAPRSSGALSSKRYRIDINQWQNLWLLCRSTWVMRVHSTALTVNTPLLSGQARSSAGLQRHRRCVPETRSDFFSASCKSSANSFSSLSICCSYFLQRGSGSNSSFAFESRERRHSVVAKVAEDLDGGSWLWRIAGFGLSCESWKQEKNSGVRHFQEVEPILRCRERQRRCSCAFGTEFDGRAFFGRRGVSCRRFFLRIEKINSVWINYKQTISLVILANNRLLLKCWKWRMVHLEDVHVTISPIVFVRQLERPQRMSCRSMNIGWVNFFPIDNPVFLWNWYYYGNPINTLII